MRFFRPCSLSSFLYKGALFRLSTREKLLCLSFDDGPDPESTLPLLDLLDKHKVKALFFCSGESAEKYPWLIDKIKAGGHMVGNHGYRHPDGWKTPLADYCEDVERASPLTSSYIFRPPYGRIRFSQYRKLRRSYRVVFWDIMPYDYQKSFGQVKSLEILKRMIRPGSIIALHDKPDTNTLSILEPFISFCETKGYRFALP